MESLPAFNVIAAVSGLLSGVAILLTAVAGPSLVSEIQAIRNEFDTEMGLFRNDFFIEELVEEDQQEVEDLEGPQPPGIILPPRTPAADIDDVDVIEASPRLVAAVENFFSQPIPPSPVRPGKPYVGERPSAGKPRSGVYVGRPVIEGIRRPIIPQRPKPSRRSDYGRGNGNGNRSGTGKNKGKMNECPPGPPGTPGLPGLSGYDGIPGEDGLPGPDADDLKPEVPQQQPCFTCPPGPLGITGTVGRIGRRGMKGSMGASGTNGVPGSPGTSGPRGKLGPSGLAGKSGRKGYPGLFGTKSAGARGPKGASGLKGLSGSPGTSGRDAFNGLPGGLGPMGPIGRSGLPGNLGQQGSPGFDGTPGSDGKYCICPSRVGSEVVIKGNQTPPPGRGDYRNWKKQK